MPFSAKPFLAEICLGSTRRILFSESGKEYMGALAVSNGHSVAFPFVAVVVSTSMV
jgi:hypothetical protein